MRRVGIDLALKGPHKAIVLEDGHAVGRAFAVPMELAGFEKLLTRANAGDGQACEFILEPTGNAWQVPVAWLMHRGQTVLIGTGRKVSDLRKVYRTHTKTDVIDCEAAARLGDLGDRAVYPAPAPARTQASLARLVKQRAAFVTESTQHKLRIESTLDLANPHGTSAFKGNLFAAAGRAFLRKYLNPLDATKLGQKALIKFLSQHFRGDFKALGDRVWKACETTGALYQELDTAGALPFDPVQLQEEVNLELELLEAVESCIDTLDKRIDTLYQEIDPKKTLTQLKGIGPTIGASLEAIIGDVGRFHNARAFVSHCGRCPGQNQTGKSRKSGQRVTKTGNRLLKHYLYLAAEVARQWDPEFAHKYHDLEAKGKHHFNIMIVLAHMMARRVYNLLWRRDHGLPSEFDLRDPGGQSIASKEARELINERYPSKREKQRREKLKQTQEQKEVTGTTSASQNNRKTSGTPHPGHGRGNRDGSQPVNSGQSKDSTSRRSVGPRPGAHNNTEVKQIGALLIDIMGGIEREIARDQVVETRLGKSLSKTQKQTQKGLP